MTTTPHAEQPRRFLVRRRVRACAAQGRRGRRAAPSRSRAASRAGLRGRDTRGSCGRGRPLLVDLAGEVVFPRRAMPPAEHHHRVDRHQKHGRREDRPPAGEQRDGRGDAVADADPLEHAGETHLPRREHAAAEVEVRRQRAALRSRSSSRRKSPRRARRTRAPPRAARSSPPSSTSTGTAAARTRRR